MPREMLINVAETEECRVAVVENGSLEELYVERPSLSSRVGNIYKAKIVNIEAGIQAAFVDFGIGRNGFLHISDLHHRHFPRRAAKRTEKVGRRESLRQRPPIQNCLHKGDEIVVQVTKEGLKTKGPTLSTYLALPGKYLVMMPWMHKHGVSHKIEDDEERKRLRRILQECALPKGHGFIVRTAGRGCSKRDIQNDLRYLRRLWAAIKKRMDSEKAPGELYQESNLVIRAIRDVFNSEISEVICDSESVVRKITDFLSIATPRLKRTVTYYDGRIPLFSGGSLVIEQTEALVSIDVNSGRYRRNQTAERTAYETNMEAAVEMQSTARMWKKPFATLSGETELVPEY
jgi:ribonuclease E